MTDAVAAPTAPIAAARPTLFPTLHLDNFKPLELCFGILLALATNCWRQRTPSTGSGQALRPRICGTSCERCAMP